MAGALMIIALCGNLTPGKTEVQNILARRFKFEPIDDGWPLRDFAVRHLGASIDDVTTQAGKATLVTLPGRRTMLWREFLGEFGNAIEALLGSHAIPEMAIRRTEPGKDYSFGSVRRDQGLPYKRAGGIVIGIEAPWAKPSPHEFDRFDMSLVEMPALRRALSDVEIRLYRNGNDIVPTVPWPFPLPYRHVRPLIGIGAPMLNPIEAHGIARYEAAMAALNGICAAAE